jgi:hypothetical protein
MQAICPRWVSPTASSMSVDCGHALGCHVVLKMLDASHGDQGAASLVLVTAAQACTSHRQASAVFEGYLCDLALVRHALQNISHWS